MSKLPRCTWHECTSPTADPVARYCNEHASIVAYERQLSDLRADLHARHVELAEQRRYVNGLEVVIDGLRGRAS